MKEWIISKLKGWVLFGFGWLVLMFVYIFFYCVAIFFRLVLFELFFITVFASKMILDFMDWFGNKLPKYRFYVREESEEAMKDRKEYEVRKILGVKKSCD